MRYIPAFFIFILSLILQSCNHGNAEAINYEASPVTFTVVLCDLTKSIDTSAIDSIATHAVQIKSQAIDGEQIFYYGIGPTDFNVGIGEYAFSEPLRETDEGRTKRLAIWHRGDSLLLHKIKQLYFAEKYQNTCITYALNTAYELLKEKKAAANNATLNIVVLSDMIEDCTHYSLGKLHLDSKDKMTQTRKIIATDMPTNINLKQLGVHLYMVSESEIAETKLSRCELQDTWRLLLTKFGYSENDSLVAFEWQRLPDKILSEE